eukprot:EG_transcript_5334
MGPGGPGGRPPKAAKVRNKTPAEIQITAEQILREAKDRQEPELFIPPRRKITDPVELQAYQLGKRKDFEDKIRRNRNLASHWYKYGAWEESQQDFARARSVYERAMHIDYRNPAMWQRYAEMEMRNGFLNHARNVWERATTLLPRVDALWLKWVHMEETAGNVPGARQVFERWMQYEPGENAWKCYVKMEQRYGEIEKAREVIQRFVMCHNVVDTWLYYAKFEEKTHQLDRARRVFEEAVEALGEFAKDEKLFVAFAKFEERQKEYERARAIFRYALDNVPKGKAEEVYAMLTAFEKQHGDTKGIEDVVISRKRFQFEEELKVNPRNYDVWVDYARLEEGVGDTEKCRDVYERAISFVPKAAEKVYWARYIYLWIMYALYEELEEEDVERTRAVYEECLKVLPHRRFSFSKVWLLYAHFEVRQGDLPKARRILGTALGRAPKNKLYRQYIDMELQLGELDRVRKLYQKWLQYNPTNTQVWVKYATLEDGLEERERARYVFSLAVRQPALDMPEVCWKAFIDFEVSHQEHSRARKLYEELLGKTRHYKVYIAFAMFETNVCADLDRARDVFQQGYQELSTQQESTEELATLLQNWLQMEQERGTPETVSAVEDKINPNRRAGASKLLAKARAYVQRKRKADDIGTTEPGVGLGA